jgi:hypothetical protein
MKRSLNPFLIPLALYALLFSLFGPLPAAAQQVIRIQTISATLAKNATCTGSAQNYTTAQGIAGFQNIGQTSHLATAISNAPQFSMEIDGIDNSGNVFRLSPVQVGTPTNAKSGFVVAASGYMTNIQVAVTCSSGSTFTVSYSGSFSPSPISTGGAQLTAIDTVPFQTAAAGSNASNTFQSPTSSSAGTVVFQYATTGPSGSSVSIQCVSNASVNLQSFSFSLTTGTSPQLFPVPSSTCPFADVSYNSGGSSATTYNLEYVFSASGSPSVTADPCQSPQIPKSFAVVTLTGTGTVGSDIVPAVVGKAVTVCGVVMTFNDAATAQSDYFQLGSQSSGGSCISGVTFISEWLQETGHINAVGMMMGQAPAGDELCAIGNGDGTHTYYDIGVISYVQQ